MMSYVDGYPIITKLRLSTLFLMRCQNYLSEILTLHKRNAISVMESGPNFGSANFTKAGSNIVCVKLKNVKIF